MKKWNIHRTQYKVSDFVNWQRNDELNLSPSFQRRSVWPRGAKSYLVDSILKGLPIPPIILRDLPADVRTFKAVREVVDGQQRIRTILSYVAPQTLNDYEAKGDFFKLSRTHTPEFSGKTFLELPDKMQQQILDYQFMVHLFPSETDDRDILEIFARMNATGVKLNNQELRNAQYFGEFKTRAFVLAAEHLDLWRNWKTFSESAIARMAEVEFVSELMIFIMDGVTSNEKKVIDRYYEDYDEEFPEQEEVISRLRWILDNLRARLPKEGSEITSSKTILYAIFAAVYSDAFGIESTLRRKKPTAIRKSRWNDLVEKASQITAGTAPSDVLLASERRVSQANSRRTTIDYIAS
ncbi:DUF262 domain-containing protein [Thalassoroseus pseudoceratinae]|uniref:DUF262 domain-containing protein n=1 Tax=Thalassoroseus pseudoceratinae TaxID=2713176 RepID=UPI00141DDF6D|nr:DUF262 domain-containing protein [Thalassoroseus pseudoceratinae]